jgi:hypothetical protein
MASESQVNLDSHQLEVAPRADRAAALPSVSRKSYPWRETNRRIWGDGLSLRPVQGRYSPVRSRAILSPSATQGGTFLSRAPSWYIYPSAGIGLLASGPACAVVFNLLPQAALAVAPLICTGEFVIHRSARRTSHEYLCQVTGVDTPTDVTFMASALTWLLLWLGLSALVFIVFLVVNRKSCVSD